VALAYSSSDGKYREVEAFKIAKPEYRKKNFLDCKKECETATGCEAFETGPLDTCYTYKWVVNQAGTADTRTPLKAAVSEGVKCYIRNNYAGKRRSEDFENMVWKSAETVGFGVKSPWVVAWYCSNTFPTTLKARNASDRKANVLKTQIVNGYNSAYNKLALKTHNIKRQAH
jgi:hypothetical protein